MKKRLFSIISMILVIATVMSVAVSCGGGGAEITTEPKQNDTTENPVVNTTETPSDEPTEAPSEEPSEEPSEDPTEEPTEEPTEVETEIVLEGEHADIISLSNKLANQVQYSHGKLTQWNSQNGSDIIINNSNMSLTFLRDADSKQILKSLTDTSGNVYIKNTFDAFIRMKDGKTYYVSNSTVDSYTNVFRHGYYYSEIRLERHNFADENGNVLEGLEVERIFHTYSDKLHHELQVTIGWDEDYTPVVSAVGGIESIGMITAIDASTVEKIIVGDANGDHDTIDGVDWSTAAYVAFDIKGTGIFGYILPVDDTTGKLTVFLENGQYVITQERAPAGNAITAGNKEVRNDNDFYMGQRLYTDKSHSFDAFLKEAYIERNPLTAKNIKVSTAYSDGGKFVGYDALRGSYVLYVAGDTFNDAYSVRPNKHYELNFTVKGDAYDRTIYTVVENDIGTLECSILLDSKLMVLPVPLEVCKNFPGDGDQDPSYFTDLQYSEVIFPISVKAEQSYEYNVVNLYQNWGNFPLKQICSIHFFVPYFHLSTGVTETNCIYYVATNVDMLPDHRGMSAPFWSTSPQHTSGGQHYFFTYVNAKGKTVGARSIDKIINSYGPIYADIDMTFLTDDGKVAVTLSHMEMPQTDENRGYYQIKIEFLDNITINNFKDDVVIYRTNSRDSTGKYTQFGYLDANNVSIVSKVNGDSTKSYVLGDECPYFTYFNMVDYSGAGGPGYSNVSFLIANSEIILGGENVDANFVVTEGKDKAVLSLNLGEVKIKKGDSITINAIIMPWGSQESDYSGKDHAPDQNVRDVRKNTLLDPVKVTPIKDCEAIEDAFMHLVKTTNGKNAEFTISGGENNMAVRVYGYTELSAPIVYEKINGEWTLYQLSSAGNPDKVGWEYNYDGYASYYDGDGTYSYSFIVDMTGGVERTFKVVTDANFEGFARIPVTEKELTPYNVYIDSTTLANISNMWHMLTNIEAGEDSCKYTRLTHSAAGGAECYFRAYQAEKDENGKAPVTGQYIVVKYRVPETNPVPLVGFEIYANTITDDVMGSDRVFLMEEQGFIQDGKWHVLIIDATTLELMSQKVLPDENGEYRITHIRIDEFNQKTEQRICIDLAYFAIHDNLEEIYDANLDMEEVFLLNNDWAYTVIDPSTGKPVK